MNVPINSISDRFDSLPGVNTKVFRRIWGEKQFLYQKRHGPDSTDDRSARLITAAVAQKQSLFVVLPDEEPRRPAFLLSTALITLWWHGRESRHAAHQPCLLYFGSHVGVREQLRNTSIGGWKLDLASVFDQTLISRRLASPTVVPAGQENSSLPHVMTAYSPVDPVAIIRTYKPDLIAVDLADVTHADWFEPVVAHTAEANIPVIAWGTNPLSTCVQQFDAEHIAFVWPPSEFFSPDAYPTHPTVRHSGAIVLTGQIIDEIDIPFRRAYGLLFRTSKAAATPLEHRAIAIHWNYLRALESMSIPLELYEAEAPRFWGLRPIQSIREACEQFRDSVQPSIAADLEAAARLLDQVCETIADAPPIWTALTDLCVDPKAAPRRAITFTGRSRKQLFLFAILARYNISQEDLRESGTEVWSRPIPSFTKRACYGLRGHIGKFTKPAAATKTLAVSYSGRKQIRSVSTSSRYAGAPVSATYELLFSSVEATSAVFRGLGVVERDLIQAVPESPNKSVPQQFPDLIRLDSSTIHKIDGKVSKPAPSLRSRRVLLKENAAVDELTRLFESEEVENSLDTQGDAGAFEPEIGEGTQDNSSSDFVPDALVVSFREGFRITFASDYIVQVIVTINSRQELRERYVAALRPDDRIVYIQGQRRQNLYDLIVSRVHRHPAFEVHLSFIRRWQDDLRLACLARVPRLTPEEILARIKDLGSAIKLPLTIRSWIHGDRLCPDDPEDLNRIAQVMDLGFVATQYRRIHKAALRIRGIHIGLALRLNNWLERAGVEAQSDTEIFDQELGLTFGDFRHSLVMLTVDSFHSLPGPFLRSALGQLERQ